LGFEIKAESCWLIKLQMLTLRLFDAQVRICRESALQVAASMPAISSVIVAHHPSAWFSTI